MLLQENLVVADRFRLVRMIGRGGMGSVWQATHVGLDTPCALKFIEGEIANLAEAHARFEREAKAAAQVRSQHVVQVFDHGVWQGIPYIAMELLNGEDLGKRLSRSDGTLAPAEVARIVHQVCRALAKAHQAGIVHRDLKPDNIFLVSEDDQDEIVKILDFGVAKQTAHAIDGSNTKTGAMLGTPYYMSPEQAQGIKSVDARSDLWSLAVIVYQCLTGRLPFESEALGDLLVKIIVAPVPVPSQVTPNVPPGFDRWWARAADRNVEGRFQTAREFAESLQLCLGQSASSVGGDRFSRIGSGTAILPASAAGEYRPQVGSFASTPHPAVAPQPPFGQTGNTGGATYADVEPSVPKKSSTGIFVGIAAGLLVLGGGAAFVTSSTRSAATSAGVKDVATNDRAAVEAIPPAAVPSAPAAVVASATPNASASAAPVASDVPPVASDAPPAASVTRASGGIKKPAASSAGGKPAAGKPAATAPASAAAPARPKNDLGF